MGDFLLDTNVLSELFRPEPDPGLVAWLEKKDPQSLYLSVLTLAEIRAGIEKLPSGKKRQRLEVWLQDSVLPNFEERLLSFDPLAASVWGSLVAQGQKAGRPRPTIDLMIAAIAIAQKLTLVTRNIKDFENLGLSVLNPFSS